MAPGYECLLKSREQGASYARSLPTRPEPTGNGNTVRRLSAELVVAVSIAFRGVELRENAVIQAFDRGEIRGDRAECRGCDTVLLGVRSGQLLNKWRSRFLFVRSWLRRNKGSYACRA